MIDTIANWAINHYPVIFWIVVLIVVTIILTRKISKFTSRLDKAESHMETASSRLDTVSDRLETVSSDLRALTAFLSAKYPDMNPGFVRSNSPMQLTEFGSDVLEKSGAKSYIDQNVESIIQDVRSHNFKSNLDVQNYAMDLAAGLFRSDSFIPVRNYIYENPIYKTPEGLELPLTTSSIYQIIGIYIRNLYFEKHGQL